MAMNGQNDFPVGNGDNASGSRPQFSDKPVTILHWDFPGNHLLKLSLVYQQRESDFKSDFFGFITACPRGDNTYITDRVNKIAFKVELDKMKNLGHVLAAYSGFSPGAAGGVLGKFVMWADSSKANVKGEETEDRSAKALEIEFSMNKSQQKGQPKFVVNMTFKRGKYKGPKRQGQEQSKYDTITVCLQPWEAKTISEYILRFADEGTDAVITMQKQASRDAVAALRAKHGPRQSNNQQAA